MRHLGYTWSHAKAQAAHRGLDRSGNCPACGSKRVNTNALDPSCVECECRRCGKAWVRRGPEGS